MNQKKLISVLRVGRGRGFVVNYRNYLGHPEPIVITAAHCLPKKLPPPHPERYLEEATYRRLLGPLGGKRTCGRNACSSIPLPTLPYLVSPSQLISSIVFGLLFGLWLLLTLWILG
jgi:hypothetical protein